jgi:hypothetical protein
MRQTFSRGGACPGDASPDRSAWPTVPGLRSASGARSSLAALGTPWPLAPPDVRLPHAPGHPPLATEATGDAEAEAPAARPEVPSGGVREAAAPEPRTDGGVAQAAGPVALAANDRRSGAPQL